MSEQPVGANMQDPYIRAVDIKAPIATVFAMVATLEGIKAWWDGSVIGDASEQGRLRFSLPDSDDYTQMSVDSVIVPSDVAWSVLDDSGFGGEWMGTSIFFHVEDDVDGSSTLTLHHKGLTPALDCFMDCVSGWDRHLDRIRKNAEMTC